jgi:hypothetical protein
MRGRAAARYINYVRDMIATQEQATVCRSSSYFGIPSIFRALRPYPPQSNGAAPTYTNPPPLSVKA